MLLKTGKARKVSSVLTALVLLGAAEVDPGASTVVCAGVVLDGSVFLNRMSFLQRKC